jgi:hypothetical protein
VLGRILRQTQHNAPNNIHPQYHPEQNNTPPTEQSIGGVNISAGRYPITYY